MRCYSQAASLREKEKPTRNMVQARLKLPSSAGWWASICLFLGCHCSGSVQQFHLYPGRNKNHDIQWGKLGSPRASSCATPWVPQGSSFHQRRRPSQHLPFLPPWSRGLVPPAPALRRTHLTPALISQSELPQQAPLTEAACWFWTNSAQEKECTSGSHWSSCSQSPNAPGAG